MTVDLQDQLRELCAVMEEEQGPLSADEVLARETPLLRRDAAGIRLMGRRSWLAAAAAAVLTVVVIGGLAWLSRNVDTPPVVEPTTSLTPETTLPTDTTLPPATTTVPPEPVQPPGEVTHFSGGPLVATADALWMGTWFRLGPGVPPSVTEILRIDRATLETTDAIPIGESRLEHLVAAEDAVWAVLAEPASLVRIDATSREVTDAIAMPLFDNAPGWAMFAFDALWMMQDATLVRVDATTGAVTEYSSPGVDGGWWLWAGAVDGVLWAYNPGGWVASFDLAAEELDFYAYDGPFDGTPAEDAPLLTNRALWVVENDGARLHRFDLETRQFTDRLVLGCCIRALLGDGPPRGTGAVFAEGAVWKTRAARVIRIDPVTAETTDVIDLGENAWQLVDTGDGTLWVTHLGQSAVSRIDTATLQMTEAVDTGSPVLYVLSDRGTIWVLDEDLAITRLE